MNVRCAQIVIMTMLVIVFMVLVFTTPPCFSGGVRGVCSCFSPRMNMLAPFTIRPITATKMAELKAMFTGVRRR